MKNIQKLKKQLLREELSRQGKAPKYKRWLFCICGVAFSLIAWWLWYQANLDEILAAKFQKGLSEKASGQYDRSNTTLQSLVEEYPKFEKNPEALIEVAETLDLYQARYRDALLVYLLLVRDYPGTVQAKIAQKQIAELYKYRFDDCGQAIAAYQQILDQEETNGEPLHYEVADCYFRLNNFEQARIEFETLLKKYPSSPLNAEIQYRIAVTYALEGQLHEAEAAYRLVAETWPDSPYSIEGQFGLAAVLEEQERLREALEILDDIQGVYPNQDALQRKQEQLRVRIDKKKKAI
ncbi:MAG: tetratricopeptide repeat protein [Deltaproteobacteria bacterium]|jgi:TolA-binding protein|nr:tetratricopeptide repeat protein [Deltaproteobacteria bacterium]MBW2503742.1 tetratricopeptide repeat protein [Deltaproteobacteria bacterium]MBW2520500.1 tetratricopeptide repeat protein [Deltaproteobacteria bacterium]